MHVGEEPLKAKRRKALTTLIIMDPNESFVETQCLSQTQRKVSSLGVESRDTCRSSVRRAYSS
jgi:hypothetical protein